MECDFCEALVDLNNLYQDVNKINVIKHQGGEEKKNQQTMWNWSFGRI